MVAAYAARPDVVGNRVRIVLRIRLGCCAHPGDRLFQMGNRQDEVASHPVTCGIVSGGVRCVLGVFAT